MTDYALVLLHHADYAGLRWSIKDSDYSTLRWHESNAIPKPSQTELDAAWPQVEYDLKFAAVARARHAAYVAPDGPDSIFFKWQRGDATEQEYVAAVQAVKDAHPYPDPLD
jgi:hypothetical protein